MAERVAADPAATPSPASSPAPSPGVTGGFPQVIWIGHARLAPIEVASLIGGLAVFGYLGWDSALWDGRLQLVLHLIAGIAIAAGIFLLLRGRPFPRTGLEAPILALLLLLGLASIVGENPGLAGRALAASVAFAALLPIALFLVRRYAVLTALAVTVPTLATAVWILWQLVARRLDWFTLGIGGLPPVRLSGESTAFGSVAVPPFVLLGVLPLCLILEPRWFRRVAIGLTLALLVPLSALSGSRSSWLAIGVAALVYVAPEARRLGRLRPRRLGPGSVAIVVAAAGFIVLAVAFVAPRFTAITSVIYRERLWQDTITAWSVNPLLGIGPGTMPYARQAAAAVGAGPVRQPHSHDLALGVLGDGGILALAAGLMVVGLFLWIAGPHRSHTRTGRAASSVLVGFLAAGLVEDLTFLPNFDLIVLLLAAVAVIDAGAVRWVPLRLPSRASTVAAIAAIGLLVPVLLGDAASAAFRNGAEAAYANDWRSAAGWYALAVRLDPSHPSGPLALAVAADMVGDAPTALAAARQAVVLNRGDGSAWTNLALLCLAAGDESCAQQAAEAAVRTAGLNGREYINAALVEERLGHPARADELYRLSLVTSRNTALSVAWPRRVDPDSGSLPVAADPNTQLAKLLAEAAAGKRADPPAGWAPAVRAVAFAINGDRHSAMQALESAMRDSSADPLTWEVATVLEVHWRQDARRAEDAAVFLRGSPLDTKVPPIPQVTYEIASLRAYPRDGLVRSAERLAPDPPWPWALMRFLPPAG